MLTSILAETDPANQKRSQACRAFIGLRITFISLVQAIALPQRRLFPSLTIKKPTSNIPQKLLHQCIVLISRPGHRKQILQNLCRNERTRDDALRLT